MFDAMTQTKQHRSLPNIKESEKKIEKIIPETEDNMTLLLSVYDSLNKLCDKLSRLNYLLGKRNVVQIPSQKGEAK